MMLPRNLSGAEVVEGLVRSLGYGELQLPVCCLGVSEGPYRVQFLP